MNGYNFTERVRTCLALSRDEAVELRHEYVGTEHLLLGIIHEGNNIAVTVLENLGVKPNDIRDMIEGVVKRGIRKDPPGPHLPYTSRAKKVLELSMNEARSMNHSYVGVEHLLLGLLAEKKGIAAQILVDAGVTLDAARAETLNILGPETNAQSRTIDTAPSARGQLLGGGHSYSFTERVRKCLTLAREEAARLNYEYVGTEHLLLGIIVEGEGVAATVLQNLGVDLNELRDLIERSITPGKASNPIPADLPYANHAKKALELAMAESRRAGHSYVGTEHLLLGLLREESGLGAMALTSVGVTLENARAETFRVLGAEMPAGPLFTPSEGALRAQPLRRVTPRLRDILNEACSYTRRVNAETPVMIAVALLRHAEGAMRALLDHLEVDIAALLDKLEPLMAAEVAATEGADLVDRAKKLRELFLLANAEAERTHDELCSSGHMLVALVATSPTVAEAFLAQGFGVEDVRREFARLSG